MFQLAIEDDADYADADVGHHRIYYSDSNVTRVELGKGRIYAAITPDSRWIFIDPLDVIDVRTWRRYNLSKSLGDGYVVFLGITDDGQRMFFHQQPCPFDCTKFPVTFYELTFPRQ